MNKTNISAILIVAIVALLFFLVGRKTQPTTASAKDATVQAVTTRNAPKATFRSVPRIPVVPGKNHLNPEGSNEEPVVDPPLRVAAKYFLDKWEEFSTAANLTPEEELRVLDILADMQERLLLLQAKAIDELGELPRDSTTYSALRKSTRNIDKTAVSATQRRISEFLSPQQVQSFEKTFFTFIYFTGMGWSIREFMGLTSKSRITQAEIGAVKDSKNKLLRVKKPQTETDNQ